MKRYYLNAEGNVVPGHWQGKLRAAALQAPKGYGCVAETDHRLVISSNGWMTAAQAAVALDKMDAGKASRARSGRRRAFGAAASEVASSSRIWEIFSARVMR